MQTFRVWATLPKKIEVQVNGKNFPMTAANNGWWTVEVATAKTGDDYGFILDGEGPFPDPRSPLQPNGVHKLSRLVDHNQFMWTDKNWQAPPLTSAQQDYVAAWSAAVSATGYKPGVYCSHLLADVQVQQPLGVLLG